MESVEVPEKKRHLEHCKVFNFDNCIMKLMKLKYIKIREKKIFYVFVAKSA